MKKRNSTDDGRVIKANFLRTPRCKTAAARCYVTPRCTSHFLAQVPEDKPAGCCYKIAVSVNHNNKQTTKGRNDSVGLVCIKMRGGGGVGGNTAWK